MADTVKKSRIVSEPDSLAFSDEDTSLQDIINQEFNQRLKSCMCDDTYLEPNAEHIALTYETGEVQLKNGDVKPAPTTPTMAHTVVPTMTPMKVPIMAPTEAPPTVPAEEPSWAPTVAPTEAPPTVPAEELMWAPTMTPIEAPPTVPTEESSWASTEAIIVGADLISTDLKSTLVLSSNEVLNATKEEMNGRVSRAEEEGTPQHILTETPAEDSIIEHSTNGLNHSIPEEVLQVLEVHQEASSEDSFVNKEVPSPEEVESPFDNVTVTDVDNENLTAKERFLSTVKDIEDESLKTIKDRMFLSTDSACLLFTQTVVQSPMLTPTDENYDFLQGLQQNSSDATDHSSPVKNEEIVPILENLSSKPDNLELIEDISEISAENEVCNSNSEEDSLKNEETIDNQEDVKNLTLRFIETEILSSNTEKSEKSKMFLHTPTIVEHLVEDLDPENDEIIEDYNITGNEDIPKEAVIIEDVDIVGASATTEEEICNTTDSSTKTEIEETPTKMIESSKSSPTAEEPTKKEEPPSTPTKAEELSQEIEETPTKIIDSSKSSPISSPTAEEPTKKEEPPSTSTEKEEPPSTPTKLEEPPSTTTKTEEPPSSPTENIEPSSPTKNEDPFSSPRSSPSKVSEISKIFSPKDSEDSKEEIRSPVLEETFEDIKKTKEIFEKKSEESTTVLKSCDLVKRFSDPMSPGSETSECETNNVCDFSSTITTESSFVETRTEANSNQDKVLKKKKSKKSKKDNEKENISVCDYTNTNDEDTLSHVSVKNLCRSFSDLTSIGSKNVDGKTKTRIVYGRTKSMSDIRRDDVNLDSVFSHVSVKSLKSSFSKFDALQKKTVLHVRSSDSGKAQEKFNGNAQIDTSSCKSCGKQVFQMEQIKAEKAIYHKNCFRCQECNKQLNVDTYQSNEGVLYCKPHFKALFTPKAVEDEPQPTSDKPDLGLEELQNLNVKERFQVFEHHENQENNLERTPSAVNVKRSPSILSKLAKFQSKGMDIGVADDSLNGVPVEESSSEEEEEEEEIEGEDAELVRAKRAQREKPMHFTNMSDVMSKWESGNGMSKEERREERKQEIQSIRSRLFMGKQAKIKEMYQQAVADSSSGTHVRKQVPLDSELSESTRSLRERFERGDKLSSAEQQTLNDADDAAVFDSGISKKSRSIFLELDANASKPPSLKVQGKMEVRRAREAFMARQASDDVVRASDQLDDVEVKTADISNRFKFFEAYKEPTKQRKEFRITPPRDSQVKDPDTPDEDTTAPESPLESDTAPAETSHTTSRMLSVFRQLEESAGRDTAPQGLKPLKRFTPPPEPQRTESESEEEYSEEEEDDDEEDGRVVDEDLLEAQKAARAKHLRAKFEKWEANEIKREQNNSSVNIAEEMADADSQIESAKSLRARFESMRETTTDKERTPRVKVNRFVDTTNNVETCKSCEGRVYPLEKVSCHNNVYHKNCFRCRECNTILRMDSYTYNQGLLYCLPHFKRLFIAKGNYEAGFGLDQHKEKWNAVA